MIRFDNLPPEVMQAMCTPMHLILPPSQASRTGALFLGSFSAILDASLLQSNAIGALVQVLDAPWLPSVDAHAAQGVKLECYRLDILDNTSADLKPHLEATVRWIDDRLRRGVNVLVHCQQVCLRDLVYEFFLTYIQGGISLRGRGYRVPNIHSQHVLRCCV
jgi:hypothetical protein